MHSVSADQLSLPLRELLIILGRNLLETMMTPLLLEVCYTATLEADRYPDATRVCAQHGRRPAIAVLTKIQTDARQVGEVDLADCEGSARQFLGLLPQETFRLEAVPSARRDTVAFGDRFARPHSVKAVIDGAGLEEPPILAREIVPA